MEKSYKYLGYFLMLLIPLTIAGFYKTYIGLFPDFGERIDFYIHLHTLFASLWIVMLIVQPILIVNKKWALHRKVGKLSYVLFPLLILSFIPQMIKMVNRGEAHDLFFPVSDSIMLTLLYSLAIYNRKRSSRHMRYMIAIALVFLGPTIGRIGPHLLGWSMLFTQSLVYAIIYCILVSLIIYDRWNKRQFRPYLIATIFFVIHQSVFYWVFL